jgi:hypothetical protein
MPGRRKLGRELRALWATLAVICLIGAGAAYGATRYVQDGLEADARRDAQKLTTEVLRPVLTPRDVADPIRGARYDELLAYVQQRVLAGPIVGVRLWRSDGTILFANVESLVGDRDAGMRGDLHSAIAGTSLSTVEGDRFHALTSMRIGNPPTIVTAELIRSHAAIVEESRQRWYPWVARGLTAAAVCAGLSVITAIAFALVAALGGLAKRREATGSKAPSRARGTAARGVPETPTDETLPAYMRPGFREEFEARQRAAIEMAVAQQERDQVEARARRMGLALGDGQGQAPSTV